MVTIMLLSLTALTAHIMSDLQVLTYNFSFYSAPSFILFSKIAHFVLITFINYIFVIIIQSQCHILNAAAPFYPLSDPYTPMVGLAITPSRPIPQSSSYLLQHTYTGTNMGQL